MLFVCLVINLGLNGLRYMIIHNNLLIVLLECIMAKRISVRQIIVFYIYKIYIVKREGLAGLMFGELLN